MRRRKRSEYQGDQYPSRETFFNRRRFLLGVGKVTVIAAASLTFGRRVRALDAGGVPQINELPDGTFQVEVPGAPDYLSASGNQGSSYRYRVTLIVASLEIATFVAQNHLLLYGRLDEAIRPYDYDDLSVTETRTAAEGALLQAIRDAHCEVASCTAGDFISLTLTTDLYYDTVSGCSCGTVPW